MTRYKDCNRNRMEKILLSVGDSNTATEFS